MSVLTLNASNSCIVAIQDECCKWFKFIVWSNVILETPMLSNPGLRIEGILFTVVEKNTVHIGLKEAVRETYSSVNIFETEIRKGIEIKKTQALKSLILIRIQQQLSLMIK